MNAHLHYLDSSVVLAWILEGRSVLEPLSGQAAVASSRLLWIEVSRAIHRALQTNRVSPAFATEARHNFERFAAGVGSIRLNDTVLRRAEGPFPLVTRTLDALHLASAEAWLAATEPAAGPETLALWTLDERMNYCAAQLGFATPLLG